MQYKVPQDVQREDTIIGPLTLKQMGILAVGGGIAYAIYISLSKTYFLEIWLPPVAVVSMITLAVAFLKIHSLPFHEFMMHFIEYHILARQRFWIQGSDTPYRDPFAKDKKIKKDVIEEKKKNSKDIAEISKVLDSHGELNKIINQNYKN